MIAEPSADGDVVRSTAEAARLERGPLLVLEPLAAFLDAAGLGAGPLLAAPLGEGHSNVTYAIVRGDEHFVLRRPPRGPLPPSAHDVIREATLLRALVGTRVRVPEVLAVCEDPSIIGAPFYVMHFVEGEVLATSIPAAFSRPSDLKAVAEELVDGLVEVHAVDVERSGLTQFSRRTNYLERQLRRFRGLLAQNAARPLPELVAVADWLEALRPRGGDVTLVHGDYRLGNTMFAALPEPRLTAILDWEMATVGDPLADLGYLTATWAQPGDENDPILELSRLTRRQGFPDRVALVERYAQRSGRDVTDLAWYQVLALWKTAIFLEGSYKRYLAGATDDSYFARLEAGVPALARRALRYAELEV